MRRCEACGKEDRPELNTDRECRCRANSFEPASHRPECPQIQHGVVRYPVLVPKNELVATPEHPEGELPRKWRGWHLDRDGRDFFRWRFMCRPCIETYELIQKRQKDLERRRLALSGKKKTEYAQLYLSQTGD